MHGPLDAHGEAALRAEANGGVTDGRQRDAVGGGPPETAGRPAPDDAGAKPGRSGGSPGRRRRGPRRGGMMLVTASLTVSGQGKNPRSPARQASKIFEKLI